MKNKGQNHKVKKIKGKTTIALQSTGENTKNQRYIEDERRNSMGRRILDKDDGIRPG